MEAGLMGKVGRGDDRSITSECREEKGGVYKEENRNRRIEVPTWK
jgi:hypothetical protein